jgi:Uma2 family endonuclease
MIIVRPSQAIVYPDSDGEPMAENTVQYRWITTIREGIEWRFRHRADVFTAADLFWYPVEGHPEICLAPDVLVAIGRPKGERGSYMQWIEGGIAPQVLFEVLSPGNRKPQMDAKFQFYNEYGCQEYYIYDPDQVKLTGYERTRGKLRKIREMHGWTSPLLGIRFDLSGSELTIYHPDGQRFLTWQEVNDRYDQVSRERDQIAQRAERLAAQLRALGIEPPA